MTGWLWWAWSAGAMGADRGTSLGSIPASPITSSGSEAKWRPIQRKVKRDKAGVVKWPWTRKAKRQYVYPWGDRQGRPPDSHLLTFEAEMRFQTSRPAYTAIDGELICDIFVLLPIKSWRFLSILRIETGKIRTIRTAICFVCTDEGGFI